MNILNGENFKVREAEAFRYMGIKGEADEETKKLSKKAFLETERSAVFKACYIEVPIFVAKDEIDFGFMKVKSVSLYKNLKGCSTAFIFGATLGAGIDRLISKATCISAAKGLCIDCAASSLIEVWCDEINQALAEKTDKYLRPRFSCGYGDFDISYQSDIIKTLNCEKLIGMHLSASGMLVPIKSVTAVVGVIDKPCKVSNKCETCENQNCEFRN